jgi:hypothetical protein
MVAAVPQAAGLDPQTEGRCHCGFVLMVFVKGPGTSREGGNYGQ